jgi:hypothetical protein
MKMASLIAVVFLASAFRANACELATALASWKNGDIEDALACAERVDPSGSAEADRNTFLLMAIAFAKGQYPESIRIYRTLSRDFSGFKGATILAAQAAHHLHDFALSRQLIEDGSVDDPGMIAMFRLLAQQPVSIVLDGIDIIPFDYSAGAFRQPQPSFEVIVNGSRVKAILDTGASYLAMSPFLADKLAIKTVPVGEGRASQQQTQAYLGVAEFSVGRVSATNIPVYVLEPLGHPQTRDVVVFGTTFLSNFLTTIDYPRQRLIVSAKDDPMAREQHLSKIAPFVTTMPFYMWFDHYMFAKGSLDSNSSLNFFVDSGVVDNRSGKQAAFLTSTEILRSLGYSAAELSRPFVDLRGPLGLGSLSQDGLLAAHRADYQPTSFGGVAIHGMISHAFLKRYVWTIDFKNHTYGFSG